LRETFLTASDHADVVLACRVSPKQKADIVNMIKQRFPNKVTLAIGDGANDVNMILQAHVGVGILGKEGQQAARSADYAIGQFKFLKPLMFIHGREAYRRNSMLVAYTFYKNVLYVMPQYYFGFNSAFSGQTLYEAFIYQLYNITMTSLPIMYYALFDFQYFKPTFMQNPLLYKIGMNYSCFSMAIFSRWLILALFHGMVIYLVCMIALIDTSVVQSDGKNVGFWVAGHASYGSAVIIANLVILHKFNNFTKYGEALIGLMIFAFFFFMGVESAMGISVLSHIFGTMFSMYKVWIGLAICGSVASSMELAMRAWSKLISSNEKFIFNPPEDTNSAKSNVINETETSGQKDSFKMKDVTPD